MAVDFSKAFNRMSHQACLKALARKNCSNESIDLVYKFLVGRKMHVKIGTDLSNERTVCGGSPQGTKLGNFLFCVTLELINEDFEDHSASGDHYSLDSIPESPVSAVPAEYFSFAASTPSVSYTHLTLPTNREV